MKNKIIFKPKKIITYFARNHLQTYFISLQIFTIFSHLRFYYFQILILWMLLNIIVLTTPPSFGAVREVRGTWLTTTANNAIATPQNTQKSMRQLKEIGINTVYVESWKNGYTQFPSQVLQRTLGVSQFPHSPIQKYKKNETRNLIEETLIEAHRQGLIYIAWFEYGFMAAHKSSMNHLRQQKPDWLSRDQDGNEISSNGFVWLNPLHPEARQLLLDLVIEAIDLFDLDGVQLDDRIVWPDIKMGYDNYTKTLYAQEHQGKLPPVNYNDPEWMQWRADKVTQFAQNFVKAVRAKRPGLIISLSPPVFPWSWEHHLLAWPEWISWSRQPTESLAFWDEFVPQTYRFNFADFAHTWQQQMLAIKQYENGKSSSIVAGIRIVGDGKDSSWEQLQQSIELTRQYNNAGHVLWFSRGVLDIYPTQLREFYQKSGDAISPYFPTGWRQLSIALRRKNNTNEKNQIEVWQTIKPKTGNYQVIGRNHQGWHYLKYYLVIKNELSDNEIIKNKEVFSIALPAGLLEVELVLDRREEMKKLQR